MDVALLAVVRRKRSSAARNVKGVPRAPIFRCTVGKWLILNEAGEHRGPAKREIAEDSIPGDWKRKEKLGSGLRYRDYSRFGGAAHHPRPPDSYEESI